MTYIDEDMRRIVDRAKLAFVATVRPDNSPSVSPKGSVRVYDDQHLVFMDIASPGTVANLAQNPGIDIAVVDFIARRGYRFTGLAEFRDPGTPEYSWLQTWLLDRNGPGYPAHRAVIVRVEEISPINSPAYEFGNATEQQLSEQWRTVYTETAAE